MKDNIQTESKGAYLKKELFGNEIRDDGSEDRRTGPIDEEGLAGEIDQRLIRLFDDNVKRRHFDLVCQLVRTHRRVVCMPKF